MNENVIVKSTVNATVALNVPELSLKAEWTRKGMPRTIQLDKLKQAMYDPGVEALFRDGLLYIDNMEQKIELGLEDPDTKVPTKIRVLDDKMKERLLRYMPFVDFKKEVPKYSYEQIQDLVEYAVEHEIIDMDKSDFLREITQVDIVKAVQLNRATKEA